MNEAKQKRNQRAEQLKVYQTDQEDFWVEGSDGKVAYRIFFNLERGVGRCTCPDYQTRVKSDGDFKCKHIVATADALINSDTEAAEYIAKSKPKLDERFIINIKGKDFCTYPGLLDIAHQMNLTSLKVELLQYPNKENGHEAITKAIAETAKGEVFIDIGDASPQNCDSRIAKHLIRMSSTRSKGRVLRDLCNISILAIEEIGDINDVIGSSNKVVDIKSRKPAQTKKVTTESKPESANNNNGNGNGAKKKVVAKPKIVEKTKTETKKSDNGNGSDQPKMSVAQNRALMNLSRRRGISVDEMENMSKEMFNMPVEDLSTSDAASFIRNLQQSA